ncbi:sigma-54-dependent Fis family transcriptional regulator [bacterium]|nr:sigma-54-dependent Fis family transcriptional regulator [bacterium]
MTDPTHLTILVADDNTTMRDGMQEILVKAGYTTNVASSGEEAADALKTRRFDILITDYKMAGMSGMDLLRRTADLSPETAVIVITAFGSIDLAVEAMKAGAADFLTKPFSMEELLIRVGRVAALVRERRAAELAAAETEYLRAEENLRFNYGEIVGESPEMQTIYRTIQKLARSGSSVLITGESGTGKELAARAIHNSSGRAGKPFIRVNCGALAEGVLESELFGHEKGSFTGALRRKKGRFELADQGTLFLDEIGDIPASTQIKLLRVLQEKEFERVGGEETIQVDVRVIAATNRDLDAAVKAGGFREDLYYRLYILPLHLPPLRERTSDIPLLAGHFLTLLNRDTLHRPVTLGPDAVAVLTLYDWPGNIRELSNVIERAAVLSEGPEISGRQLQQLIHPGPGPAAPSGIHIAGNVMDLDARLAQVEKEMLQQALSASGGVKARAARMLGIKESALYYKLEKYGLLKKR